MWQKKGVLPGVSAECRAFVAGLVSYSPCFICGVMWCLSRITEKPYAAAAATAAPSSGDCPFQPLNHRDSQAFFYFFTACFLFHAAQRHQHWSLSLSVYLSFFNLLSLSLIFVSCWDTVRSEGCYSTTSISNSMRGRGGGGAMIQWCVFTLVLMMCSVISTLLPPAAQTHTLHSLFFQFSFPSSPCSRATCN